MAAFLLAGANTAKAGDNLPYNNSNGSYSVDINFGQFDSAEAGDILRVSCKITNYGNEWWHPDWKIKLTAKYSTFKEISVTEDGDIDIALDDNFFSSINTTDQNNNALNISGADVAITKIELVSGATPGPHAINIAENITNGVLTSDKTSAEKDETVTLTAVSAVGYKLKNFIVNSSTSKTTISSVSVNADGTITTIGTFAMPGNDANVSAEFIDKNILYQGDGAWKHTFEAYEFALVNVDDVLRVTCPKKMMKLITKSGTPLINNNEWIYDNDPLLNEYYDDANGCFNFTITSTMLGLIQEDGLILETYNNMTSVVIVPNNSTTPSAKTDVTLTYSATTASATTASIGQTLTDAPTLTSSVEGLTYTYESSNTTVAEINSEGVVTIKGAGTTIIKAIFTGDDTYNRAEASYTLTVTEATYAITILEPENGQITVSATEATANTTITITATPNDGYKLSAVSVKAGDTNIEVSGTGNARTFTMPAQDVTISATFDVIPTVEAKIESSTGFATFCSSQPLDFTGITTLEAYYAKTVEDGNVYLQKVYGIVPAGTGLVIKGTTTNIPVAESDGETIEGNLLIGVTAETEVKAATDYVLTEKNNVAVFAQTGVNAATVSAGHAYLRVSAAKARTRTIGIGGEGTTGIENRFVDDNEQAEEVIYNLNGQRVKNPRKGLYIINGKKVLVK